MNKDYIIKETRRAGEKLAEKSNYDVHTFFENLRKNQKKNKSISKFKCGGKLKDFTRDELYEKRI